MIKKLVRAVIILLVIGGVFSFRLFLTNSRVEAAPVVIANAPGAVTAPLYDQPVDSSGKLLLSSWLDPDGSDQDQYVWDNFTLSTTQTISEIDWVGGYDPLRQGNGGPVLDFQVSIYPSIAAGTEPAVANPPLVNYMTGGNAGETAIGAPGGTNLYTYAFVLPVEFVATGGEKYWVQIEAAQQGTVPDWGIASGIGDDGNHYVKGAGAGGDVRFYWAPGDGAFTILGPILDVPTNILLTSETVDENQPVNTVVAMLAALDPDPTAAFTFSLSCAAAGADDASFNISGMDLRTSALFDYETKNVLNICIRVENGVGATLDKGFTITVKNVNEAPTGVSLLGSAVDENQPANAIAGTLSAADPDAGAAFTFSLACAAAGTDDASFNISGTNLQTSALFDFESKSSYAVCVRVTDQGGLSFDQNFLITVNNLNEGPLDISLNANLVDENQPVNTLVGSLSAADPDAGATFTFSLACAAVGADDASFNISGANLQTSAVFDFEAKSTYAICVRVIDQGGLWFDKSLTIRVNDLVEITNVPGAVTGRGSVGKGRAKGDFHFDIQVAAGTAAPTGDLTFMDHAARLRLKATSFTRLYISGSHATITGFATVDGMKNVPFTVDVYDNGTGTTDVIAIQIPDMNGYSFQGIVSKRNLTVTLR